MTDTLGLHVAADGITAVRVDASSDADPVVVPLGIDGPAAACLIAQDEGGGVRVGEAARNAPGTLISDPVERAVAGKIGALAAVINHVVGRAALGGSSPTRLAIVVPDDFDRAARDRVVEAGVAAGITDTVTVPFTAASAQSLSIDAVVAIAGGAAQVASLAAAPIVTREDLGQPVTPKQPVVVPPLDPPTGPISVFEAESEPEPEMPEPARVAAAPISATPTPGPDPTVAIPATPQPEVLRYEPPRRRVSGGLIAIGLLLGLIAAVGIGVVMFGDDETPTSTVEPVSTTAPIPTLPPTTTESTTTTIDPGATSTTLDTPTTTESTTTTTTEPPTTTTTPVRIADPGLVTLAETGLQLEGTDLLLFEQSDETVIEAVTAVLGEPDRDDLYEVIPFCFGERTRTVVWGDLELIFTEDVLDSGEGRFTQWYASGHKDPKGLVTFGGVGVGSTVGYLEVTLGGSLQLVEVIPGDPTGVFAATNPGSGALLNGTTTSLDPEAEVTALWAGDTCTRIFT